MFIKKRLLYLYQDNSYQKIYHHHLFIRQKNEATSEFIPLEEIRNLSEKYFEYEFPPFIDSYLKKLFWQHASQEIRQALIFSYEFHTQKAFSKVPNVQISCWLDIPFFQKYFQKRLFRFKLNNFDPIKFVGTKIGSHKFSVRFENIHLSFDYINNEPIFTIHWDKGYPKFSLKWFKHYIFDDIFS